MANSALIAIIASLSVISIYIALRFEWKFAVPVLIALMHDILITAGVYALVGQEVTTSTVAALLTILGFSLYDTIIVFDRIRENVPRMPSAAFSQIVNRSMSEVIVRSLATSFCTVLPVLALFLFGGETLKDFAFALLVGTLSGTYSSVFIAGPVLTHWKEREPLYRTRQRRIRDMLGYVPPYAVAAAGAPVDVEPGQRGRRGVPVSVTAPQDPTQVSRAEFDDMVANLGIEEAAAKREPAAAAAGRPAGGRRARARGNGGQAPAAPADGTPPPADGADGPTSPRSPATAGTGGHADGRARVGHGRPGHLAFHDLHPRSLLGGDRRGLPGGGHRLADRRARRQRLHGPGPGRHAPRHGAGKHPGRAQGIAAVYFYGVRQGNEPV